MSGDHSRVSFSHWRDFCARWMEQGRVHLDSDYNDLVAIVDRRLRAGTLDTIGRAAVPRETPDGFRIEAVGGTLKIHRGRIYVDGILAENHGAGDRLWDSHLAEEYRPDAIDYTKQPWLPSPPQLPGGGPYVVYLDVWLREITAQHAPEMIESAIGIDTCTASQAVWQVKLWPAQAGVTCATKLEDLPRWNEMNASSGGRLTTSKQTDPPGDNPCIAPPTAGYTGLENQLYRIEIHNGGGVDAAATATFKWSRDNASVCARVLGIVGNTRLTVDDIGKDSVLRFSDGDWVEITDDWRELNGLPGEIRRIKLGGGVDDGTQTIVLDTPLTAGLFPVDAQNVTEPARHTRITRWDQRGKILKEDGTTWVDLDQAGSTGLIPVPPAGTKLLIEQGVLAEFALLPDTEFRSLDYWNFTARASDASVEQLDTEPPRGIHHHYTKLAIVTFPDTEQDCRTLWPPQIQDGGCECTVCVSVEGHRSGKATIQQAIDSVRERGGTVCLEAGVYPLREPIEMIRCRGVRLRGQGVATVLSTVAPGSALRILNCISCAVENVSIAATAVEGAESNMIAVQNIAGLSLHRVYALGLSRGNVLGRGIGVGGIALALRISECLIFADEAIGASPELSDYLLAGDLVIEDNTWIGRRSGVTLGQRSLLASRTSIRSNTSMLCPSGALALTGASLPGATVQVSDNMLYASGDGIVVGVDDATISGNTVSGREKQQGNGIALAAALSPAPLRRIAILANRVYAVSGYGIVATRTLGAALIKQNFIERAGDGGIAIEAGATGSLNIENNHLADIAPDEAPADVGYAGISVARANHAAICNNVIARVGREKVRARSVAGIVLVAVRDPSISGNRLTGIGPRGDSAIVSDGVLLLGAPLNADINANTIHRRDDSDTAVGEGRWCGIRALRSFAKLSFAGKSFVYVVGGKIHLILLPGFIYLMTPELERKLSVRGNQVTGDNTRHPYIWISEVKTAIVAENTVCVAPNGLIAEKLVQLQDGLYTFQANVVRSVGDNQTVLIEGNYPAVALGNLTTQPIQIQSGFPPAMADLNIVAS